MSERMTTRVWDEASQLGEFARIRSGESNTSILLADMTPHEHTSTDRVRAELKSV